MQNEKEKDTNKHDEDDRLGRPLRQRLDSGIDETILEGSFNMETCVGGGVPFMLGQQLGPIGPDKYCVVEFLCGGDQALCDTITKAVTPLSEKLSKPLKKRTATDYSQSRL